ncbi:hypothetical protein TRICI_001051 [Trichomonascus ciferrii]|uniref:Uncharacterized protein n=1 Tax=Trichomonascus ciferrii TaxID=44093 RepID=A0A642VBL9_9ASCO|nr:hypothetical protein TRICI_001051 [Trichomonascus ciferrii]
MAKKAVKQQHHTAGKSLENLNFARKNVRYLDSDSDGSELSALDESDDDEEAETDDNGDDTDTTIERPAKLVSGGGKHKKTLSTNDDEDGDESSDDDEDDDDDDDDDENSDSDSSREAVYGRGKAQKKPKKQKQKKELKIPKRLDLSALRAQKEQQSAESTPVKKNQGESVVALEEYDDRLAFPRADVKKEEEESKQQEERGENQEEEEDDDDDYSSLMKMLKEEDDQDEDEFLSNEMEGDEDGFLPDFDDDGDYDENEIEKLEERAIVDEFGEANENNGDLFSNPSSPSPFPTQPHGYSVEDDYEEDDDDEESEAELYFTDDFFEPAPASALVTSRPGVNQSVSDDEDDDSYLWSYFFSSGESDSDGESTERPSSRNGFHLELPDEEYFSGDSTDEDLSLPPRSHRKSVGSRATEVVSSSNTASRPPILGSWVMSSERPFGIIDGLTTRTLSPPESSQSHYFENQQQLPQHHDLPRRRKRGFSQSNGGDSITNHSDSEVSEIALDEFIYTSDLDENHSDDDELATPVSGWSMSNGVPLSAFRNRGVTNASPYTTNHHYAQRRLPPPSASSKPSSKKNKNSHSNNNSREVVITPVRSVNRKLKRRKKQRKPLPQNGDSNNQVDTNSQGVDLIDELVEIGALSPLFSGIS